MKVKKNKAEIAVRRKFLNPLKTGNKKNLSKLNSKQTIFPKETINLLTQTYNTIQNVHIFMKSKQIVEANVLLRSAFENLVMAMVIYFDEPTYTEYKNLSTTNETRYKTKPGKLRSEFKKHIKDVTEDFFEDTSKKEIKDMLDELYDKLCNFTHSTLIVSAMIEMKDTNEEDILILLSYQNIYIVEIILFYCLKYLTHDKEHFLKVTNISMSWLIYMVNISLKFKNKEHNFKKYNEFLHYDKNVEFFEKNKNDSKKTQDVWLKFSEHLKDNEDFINAFNEFIS